MSTSAFFRGLRNKLLGVNQTHARFDVLHQQLNELSERMSTFETRMQSASASSDATMREIAARQTGQGAELAHRLGELSCLLSTESQELSERIRQDTTALFARNATMFCSHAPRPPAVSRPGVEVVEKLAFLIHSKELLNHYGCIWDLLPPDSFDIILHGSTGAASPSDFSSWRCGVVTSEDVLSSGRSYRYLVSNHPVSDHGEPLIRRLALTNIRFMYAAGKSGWNLSAWNSLYDVILCFGPYHAVNFSHASDAVIVQMGYPRFDRYFNEPVDLPQLARKLGCDPARETVVWLPTQGEISSLGHFDEEISALSQRYNVVVKLHPLTPLVDPDKTEALGRLPFNRVIVDSSDNLPLYQLADYMLFDYGGPPMAGIYTDKRMVLLNVPGAADDALTGDSSPDVAIRKQLVSVNPEAKAIATLLEDEASWHAQLPVRRRLRGLYFAPHFGFSAQVAAQALSNLDQITRAANDQNQSKETG